LGVLGQLHLRCCGYELVGLLLLLPLLLPAL
jgi:hypothetical protein